VVLSEFSSLAPDRWLAVTRTSATRRAVTVRGYRPEESSGYLESRKRSAQVGADGKVLYWSPTGMTNTNVIDVWVEQLDPQRGEDFGWSRVSDGVVTPPPLVRAAGSVAKASTNAVKPARAKARPASGPVAQQDYEAVPQANPRNATMMWPAMWEGSVTLPQAPSATRRFRLVVAEYEEYLTDDADPYDTSFTTKGRRMVYVEHTELR
jgi:hypothetical protein